MAKRPILLFLLLLVFMVPITAQEPTPDAPGFRIVPVEPRETPEPPVVDPDQVTGLDVEIPFDFPPTYEELLEEYPDLEDYVTEIDATVLEDIDFEMLYDHITEIYDAQGASGLAVFLDDSGILEKLGIPLSYLDLLRAYDTDGMEGVLELAHEREVVNDEDEIIAYMGVDDRDSLDDVIAALEELRITVYRYAPNTAELQVGIPIAILEQFETPSGLLEYLATIANIEHVTSVRPPVMRAPDSLTMQAALSVGGDRVESDLWNASGITGAGVKVGILDMGFGGIVDLINAGELPSNITANLSGNVLNNQSSPHGTACTMIVNRVAPDAELYIAYFDGSFSSMISALEWLEEKEVDIISYSVGSSVGPRDGTWGDAPLVNEYVANTGALWITAAGNEALGHTMWKYQPGDRDMHDFGDGDYFLPFTVYSDSSSIALNWNGSWDGGESDNYHIIVVDEDGNEIAIGAEPHNGGVQDYPYQYISFDTVPDETYYLAVMRESGTENHVLDIFIDGAEMPAGANVVEYSVTIPGDAAASLTVGATGLRSDLIEEYSSQGPTMDERIKPDIAAPTGEVLPVIYEEGFFGTSGSAPLISGAAALVMQQFPDMSTNEVWAYLVDNVVDLGAEGMDPTFGAGRLQLPAADSGNAGGFVQQNPADNTPSAEITAIDAQYGVKIDGVVGMTVTLSFEVNNMKSKDIAVAVVFSDILGNDLPSANPDYDIGGTIGSAEFFKVNYQRAVFSDVVLFLPDSAFANAPLGMDLSWAAGIFDLSDEDNVTALWTSDVVDVSIVDR